MSISNIVNEREMETLNLFHFINELAQSINKLQLKV